MTVPKRPAAPPRSPWSSGSFYLVVLLVAVLLVCAAARMVPLWIVPVLLIAALLALTIVGAFQLRQDDRLSEKGFLTLMALAFRQLPLLARAKGKGGPRELD
jgi:hypothetical protein